MLAVMKKFGRKKLEREEGKRLTVEGGGMVKRNHNAEDERAALQWRLQNLLG